MLEDNFKFDLQLFAEGEEPTVENTEQPTEDSNQFDFGITEDGDVVFRSPEIFGEEYAEDDTPNEEEHPAPQDSTQQETPQEELYTVKVQGQEMQVPLNELLNGYMRNADYTRKSQALAEERRALAANQYQPQVQQAPPQQEQAKPAEPEFSQKEYYEQLANYAKGQVEETLGEEYDDFNPIHQAALADAVATVKAQVYEHQQALKQQEQINARFNQMMSRHAQDPNFAQIDQFAMQKFNQLPYEQAIKIKEALDRRDTNLIDQFYTAVTNEYYGVRNVPTITPPAPKQKTPPPYMESAGAATVPPQATSRTIDWNKLGKMSTDQQAKLVRDLGLLD